MPSFEEHCRSSQLRTGKRYEELHRWMDEYQKEMGINHREKRHSLNKVETVKKYHKTEEAVREFLIHIIQDYEQTAHKLINRK